MSSTDAIVAAAEALVERAMAGHDPSHDRLHVARVRHLALDIARSLAGPVDMLVVELSSLFHDLNDRKYAERAVSIEPFLGEQSQLSESQRNLIVRICESVSYAKETKRRAAGLETDWHRDCLELHCVQDADKLDAMGAIGLMRCSAYSAVVNRPLVDRSRGDDAVAHFHEKLLKLSALMRTERGRDLARSRHRFMLDFLAQLDVEQASV